MQARIPNVDYNVAVAADANDTPEQNDSVYYSYSMFGQMPDSGLLREKLNNYRMLVVLVQRLYDLATGNQSVVGTVDVVAAVDDRLGLFDCMKTYNVADQAGGQCLLDQTLPPQRRGRLAGAWRPV
jgi:hypothetical protein